MQIHLKHVALTLKKKFFFFSELVDIPILKQYKYKYTSYFTPTKRGE